VKIEIKDNHEIHYPPSHLDELVIRHGGPPLADMISESEREMAILAEDFLATLGDSIAAMRKGLGTLGTGGHRAIYLEAFSLMGIAGTLGYPILGDLAGPLCDLVEDAPADGGKRHDLIEVTIDGIAWAAANQVRESADPRAKEMFARLEEARG
jgi:hypothetical protein